MTGRLRAHFPDEHVYAYCAPWNGDGTAEQQLGTLCDRVEADLSGAILAEIGRLEASDPLEEEIEAHRAFGEERARHFVGREEILARIRDYIDGDAPCPLIVYGASGSGKSALLARCAEMACEQHRSSVVIRRFIGATPSSTHAHSLLEGLHRQLCRESGQEEGTVPAEPKALAADVASRLSPSAEGRSLVLFVDGLDLLPGTDRKLALAWLPATLRAGVRVVLSTVDDDMLALVRRRFPNVQCAELSPMAPVEGESLLEARLKEGRRRLQTAQRVAILKPFEADGSPLYLRVASEVAKRWRSYEPPPHLPAGHGGIIRHLLDRLCDPAEHGKVLPSRVLGYLACAEYGLSEDELLDVLAADDEYFADLLTRAHHELPKGGSKQRQLPVVVWCRLLHDLEPFLCARELAGDRLLCFYHSSLGRAVDERFLSGDCRVERHRALARYFLSVCHTPDSLVSPWSLKRHHALRELPLQQARGQMASDLKRTLCDLEFIQAKCGAGLTRDLVRDYVVTDQVCPAARRELPEWPEWRQFVTSQADVFETHMAKSRHLVFQQAYNSSRRGGVSRAAQALLEQGSGPGGLWFERVNRPDYPLRRAHIHTLAGHTKSVDCVAISQDGDFIVSGSADGTIRVWAADTGSCEAVLEGHASAVTCIRLLEGGLLLSASWDRTVKLWDLVTGELVRGFAGHERAVTCLVPLSHAQFASGSADGTLRVWDRNTGECLSVFESHRRAVAAAVSLDETTLALGSEDGSVVIWDRCHGTIVAEVLESQAAITTLLAIDDGGLVLGSADGKLRVWRRASGQTMHVLEGHVGPVSGVLFLTSSQALSWGFDCSLRHWALETGHCLGVMRGHGEPVTDALLLHDGTVLSGSQDGTLRVWNIATHEAVGVLGEHRGWVNAVAADREGLVVSASSDGTVSVWDRHAPLSAVRNEPGGESLPPKLARARALFAIAILDRRTAVVCASDSGIMVRWDLEAGIALDEVLSEDRDAIWQRLREARRTEISFFGSPLSPDHFGVGINAVAEREGEDPVGMGAVLEQAGGFGVAYQPGPVAFYPLQCRPWGRVHESDRTIAFDSRTREPHVLLLHGFSPAAPASPVNSVQGGPGPVSRLWEALRRLARWPWKKEDEI